MKGKTSHLFGITVATLLVLIALCGVLIFYMHTKMLGKNGGAVVDFSKLNSTYEEINTIDDSNKIEESNNPTEEKAENVEVAEIDTQTVEDMINYRLSLMENSNAYIQNNNSQKNNNVTSKGFSKNIYFLKIL